MKLSSRAFATAPILVLLGLATAHGCSGEADQSGAGAGSAGTTMSDTTGTMSSTGPGGIGGACDPMRPPPVPETGHPRLFLTQADLPALQARAVASNPAYSEGIAKLASIFDMNLSDPMWPLDANHPGNTCYRCEFEMETFALMSLLSTDQATKDMWAGKAHKVLMETIRQGKLGPDQSLTNSPSAWDFSFSDRSRYAGRAFGLTVDWIYSYLSDQDKADIRSVFLRWADELVHAEKTSENHPEPIGVFNDPQLLADKERVRWSGNNYYVAHGRNLELLALSFDPADDPGGMLGAYVKNAAQAYLYVTDALLRGDAAGGLTPEGSEYNVSTMESLAEHMYALETAGMSDMNKLGQQVNVCGNPFYRDAVTAFFHSLAPGPVPHGNGVPYYYDFVSYGDMEVYKPYDPYFGDYIATFGPLALAFLRNGDTTYYDTVRWLAVNTAPGGPDLLNARMQDPSVPWVTMWYFFLLDPAKPLPPDPRPALSTDYWLPGLHFLFARTSWDKGASYFFWQNEWGTIDHRHGDGNNFGLYRKGEWLTTERPGYELSFFYSPSHNNVSIQNDPTPGAMGIPAQVSMLGSQYPYGHLTDPTVKAHVVAADYAYTEGNTEAHYNSDMYGAHDVKEASRALVWLKPDVVVAYDRVISNTPGRWKRYHQHLPNSPMINGNHAVSLTVAGQQVVLDAVLPAGAMIQDDPPPSDMDASGQEMLGKIVIESTAQDERFLNVIQGVDSGMPGAAVAGFASTGGSPYDGVAVGSFAVAFKHNSAEDPAGVTFSVPASVMKVIATGFAPGMGYTVSKTPNGANIDVSIMKGGGQMADTGGVLEF